MKNLANSLTTDILRQSWHPVMIGSIKALNCYNRVNYLVWPAMIDNVWVIIATMLVLQIWNFINALVLVTGLYMLGEITKGDSRNRLRQQIFSSSIDPNWFQCVWIASKTWIWSSHWWPKTRCIVVIWVRYSLCRWHQSLHLERTVVFWKGCITRNSTSHYSLRQITQCHSTEVWQMLLWYLADYDHVNR